MALGDIARRARETPTPPRRCHAALGRRLSRRPEARSVGVAMRSGCYRAWRVARSNRNRQAPTKNSTVRKINTALSGFREGVQAAVSGDTAKSDQPKCLAIQAKRIAPARISRPRRDGVGAERATGCAELLSRAPLSGRRSPAASAATPHAPRRPSLVLDGGDVARRDVQSDLLEHTAHNLAAAGLWEHGDEVQLTDHRHRAELPAHGGQQLRAQRIGRLMTLLERHEPADHLAAQLVGPTRDTGLGHRRMAQERGLHLDRADAVPGDLDDLVGAAAEPHVAVLVYGGRVPAEVDRLVGDAPPVVAAVSLRLAPKGRGE